MNLLLDTDLLLWLAGRDRMMSVEVDALIRNDPFDRLLVVQGRVEGMILLTSDTRVVEYGGAIRLV